MVTIDFVCIIFGGNPLPALAGVTQKWHLSLYTWLSALVHNFFLKRQMGLVIALFNGKSTHKYIPGHD